MDGIDLHSLTMLVEAAAAFSGTVLGTVGLILRVGKLEAGQIELRGAVQAIHTRMDASGFPQFVKKEEPHK